LLWLLLALIVLLVALLGGAWWWTGQNDSLARTITLAQRFLPADMQLQAQDVRGSLRGGGSIGQLQWSNPSLSVQVDQATIGWSLDKILDRELRLAPIHIAKLTITPSGIDKPKEPTKPLEQLPLPLRVLEVPFTVDEIVWAAPQPVTVTQLQGHYLYATDKHQLQIDQVEAFNSRLQLKADVDALAPMQTSANLKAQLDQPATDTLPAILADAGVQVSGTLSPVCRSAEPCRAWMPLCVCRPRSIPSCPLQRRRRQTPHPRQPPATKKPPTRPPRPRRKPPRPRPPARPRHWPAPRPCRPMWMPPSTPGAPGRWARHRRSCKASTWAPSYPACPPPCSTASWQ